MQTSSPCKTLGVIVADLEEHVLLHGFAEQATNLAKHQQFKGSQLFLSVDRMFVFCSIDPCFNPCD